MRLTMPAIDTKRLHLRPLKASDACDMYAYLSDERTVRYLSYSQHKDVDMTLAFMQSNLLPYVQLQDYEVLAICLQENDKMMGHLYLHAMDEDKAQITYVLHPAYWHKGYGKEAVNALVAIGFNNCKLQRIEAIYEMNHKASESLLLSCGFQREGILRHYAQLSDHKYHDMAIAAIIKKEYKGENYK